MGDRTERVGTTSHGAELWWDLFVASSGVAPTPQPRSPDPPIAAPPPIKRRAPPITIDSRNLLFAATGLAWLYDATGQLRSLASLLIAHHFETEFARHPSAAGDILAGVAERLATRFLTNSLPTEGIFVDLAGMYHVPMREGGLAVAVSQLPQAVAHGFIPGGYGLRGYIDIEPEMTFALEVTRRARRSAQIVVKEIEGVAVRGWASSTAFLLQEVTIDLKDRALCMHVTFAPPVDLPTTCDGPREEWRIQAADLASTTKTIATAGRVLTIGTSLLTGAWLLDLAKPEP